MYRLLHFASFMVCRFWCFLKREGRENIPKSGPVLLICNHTHALDTACVMLMTGRKVHFMCKQELFQRPLIGWVLSKAGCFPVDREGGGATGLMKALRLLKNGEVLCVFPEGTRNRTGVVPLLPLHKGVAALEILSKAPVVPLWVNGHFNPFHPTVMRAGNVMDLSRYAQLRKPDTESTLQMMEDIRCALLSTGEGLLRR